MAAFEVITEDEAEREIDLGREAHKIWLEWLTLAAVVIYAAIAGWQGFLMRDTANAARAANKLTEDSVRARLILSDFDLAYPLTVGKQIVGKFQLKNVGHSLGVYGIEISSIAGTRLPDGDMPVKVRSVSTPIQPDVPVSQTTLSHIVATQNFIDNIPTPDGLTQSTVSHHMEEPTKTPTVFFFGRLIYDSLGRRREQQFCLFLMRTDAAWKELAPPKEPNTVTGADFELFLCSKWNSTSE